MSDGQLRMRVRAMDREETWQPDWVAHELSGTHQAAARHRAAAAIHEAEGREQEAQDSNALADVLADQAAELERADEVRAQWYTETAGTRAAADRARLALSERGVDPDKMERPVTAEQWLAEHQADQARQDRRRVLDETEVHDKPAEISALMSQPPRRTCRTSATPRSRNGHRVRSPTGRGCRPGTRPPTVWPAPAARCRRWTGGGPWTVRLSRRAGRSCSAAGITRMSSEPCRTMRRSASRR
jgi:hypothetical protein